MRWFSLFLIAACFALSVADLRPARAEETPARGDLPTAQRTPDSAPATPPPAPGYFRKTLTSVGRTLEKAHDRIELDILDQAIRFDDFFGSARPHGRRTTSYELRWRNALRLEEGVDQGWKLEPSMSLRASMVLSKVSEKLSLALSGENDTDRALPPSLPQDPGTPGFDRTTRPTTRVVNTELRYGLLQTPSSDLFLGVGVRLHLPLEAFVRSRFTYTHRVDDMMLLRFGETLFANSDEGLGETTELTLERKIGSATLLRAAGTATASEEIEGLEWGTELSLLQELSRRSAVTLLGGIYGNTRNPDTIDTYRLLARYRRNVLRSWLFCEFEPEVFWPRTVSGSHPATFAFTFRLEILFSGERARATAAGLATPGI